MPEISVPTDRTRVVREPHRGAYDRETIDKILDEGLVCHVGFATDQQPFVIPTMFARVGDDIYFHGSAASRMLRGASAGIPVCVAVTLIDGLVPSRRSSVTGRPHSNEPPVSSGISPNTRNGLQQYRVC